ncbi:MAG: hypothetical protein LW699_10350 [Pirellula sp.]|nr:hypothetical protein [Pirellula sp.]
MTFLLRKPLASVSRRIALCLLTCSALDVTVLAQRELKDIPVPNAEVEKATFVIDEGWQAELYAGDPAMAKPIHMNFDNHGRLWIASSETYPQIKPGEPSNDKIVILEDSDKDGKADRTIVFADGLLIPTGVLPANDGDKASAYVVNSDQLLYLRDTDGDLVADEKKVVLAGFGTEDTHHLLHSLRWGHDGWIYMNQSIYIHSHIETPWGVERLNGGGIWRFHPETKRLEIVVRGFVNPWGVHFDRYGQMFATDGAYGEGINYAFEGSVFVTAVGAKRLMTGLNPGSPKHCGLEILSGSHWPDAIRGSMVTNDFRGSIGIRIGSAGRIDQNPSRCIPSDRCQTRTRWGVVHRGLVQSDHPARRSRFPRSTSRSYAWANLEADTQRPKTGYQPAHHRQGQRRKES